MTNLSSINRNDPPPKVFMCKGEEAESVALRELFESFMSCDPVVAAAQLRNLLARLQEEQVWALCLPKRMLI